MKGKQKAAEHKIKKKYNSIECHSRCDAHTRSITAITANLTIYIVNHQIS